MNIDDCINRIVKLYYYDSISLLDCVLTDSIEEPEFSANTTYNRFFDIFQFANLYYNKEYKNVFELLLETGYSKEDIVDFQVRIKEEKERYNQSDKTGDGSLSSGELS